MHRLIFGGKQMNDDKIAKDYNIEGRGLHSSTSQLNLSRVCHKKTPYTL